MTAEQFARLFRGREICRGVYPPEGDRRPATVREPARIEHYESHLKGEGPYLGIVPITLDDTCYFGAIDLDDEAADHAAIASRIDALGLPLIVCKSKSGGAHLYAFFREPVAAPDVVSKLVRWKDALGLQNPEDAHGRRPPVEVFPKQTRTDSEDLGNWINLPYYGGTRPAVHEGQELTVDQFLSLAKSRQLSAAGLEAKEPELPPESREFFTDGPPCLNTLHTTGGFQVGHRNSGLLNVGVFLKLKFPDDWEERLAEYNAAKLEPPLPDSELRDITRSLRRKDYAYKCHDAPIEDVCKKRACKKQPYGIDKFRQKSVQAQLPQLGPLEKHHTEPPYYVLRVNGRKVKVTGGELMNLAQVSEAIFVQADAVMPLMKVNEWRQIVRDLGEEMVHVDTPDDAGEIGQFMLRLREFLALRDRSDSREGLLQGKPYGQNGKVYFRSPDLLDYLERKKVRGYTSAQDVWSVLSQMDAGSTVFQIRGKRVEAWHLPTPDDEQSEEFDLPPGTEPMF